MEQFVAEFVALPRPIIYAIIGALGGVVGVLIGDLFDRLFKNNKARGVVTIICIVLSIQLTNHLIPTLQKSSAHISVMKELKESRLFQVIFRLHPEAKLEVESKMKAIFSKAKAILSKAEEDQVSLQVQTASREIVSKYFLKHLLSASDEATHALILRQLEIMKQFKNKPDLCVSYYLGQPKFKKDDLTPSFIEEELNMKADIIESAIQNPSRPPQAASIDDLVQEIAQTYHQKGYPLEDLSKLDQVSNLPPDQGCDVATKFTDALASMNANRSSYIFKNILYLSEQQ